MRKTRNISLLLIAGIGILLFQNCSMVSAPKELADQDSLGLASASPDATAANAMKILETRCASCHNEQMPSGGIDNLTDVNTLLYYRLVVPGEPQISDLYNVIASGEMPPGRTLRAEEIELIYAWIQDGFQDPGTGVKPPGSSSTVLEAKYSSINRLIIGPKCAGCHNANNGRVPMDTYNSLMNSVRAGFPDNSPFYVSVTRAVDTMPRGRAPLTQEEINAIRDWILQGAMNN